MARNRALTANDAGPGDVAPGTTRKINDATIAWSRLLIGPAAATSMKSRRGGRGWRVFTGTGLAQPINGRWLIAAMIGSSSVPIGSMWTTGLSDTRPSR